MTSPVYTTCIGCKDEHEAKDHRVVQKVQLPLEVTGEGFRRPLLPTYVCPYCDGETLVNSALRAHRERQAD